MSTISGSNTNGIHPPSASLHSWYDGYVTSDGSSIPLTEVWNTLASAGVLRRYCRVANQLTIIVIKRTTDKLAHHTSIYERDRITRQVCESLPSLHERLLLMFINMAHSQSTPDAVTPSSAAASKRCKPTPSASLSSGRRSAPPSLAKSTSSALPLSRIDGRSPPAPPFDDSITILSHVRNGHIDGMRPTAIRRMKRSIRGVDSNKNNSTSKDSIPFPPLPLETIAAATSAAAAAVTAHPSAHASTHHDQDININISNGHDNKCQCVIPCAPMSSMNGVDGIDSVLRAILPASPTPVDAAPASDHVDALPWSKPSSPSLSSSSLIIP